MAIARGMKLWCDYSVMIEYLKRWKTTTVSFEAQPSEMPVPDDSVSEQTALETLASIPGLQDTKALQGSANGDASKMLEQKQPASIQEGSIIPLEDNDARVKDGYTGSTQQHAFSKPANAEYWSSVYEKAKYEGRHRFDPSLQWSSTEEKGLVRKVIWFDSD